jgi:hypothetical protein
MNGDAQFSRYIGIMVAANTKVAQARLGSQLAKQAM